MRGLGTCLSSPVVSRPTMFDCPIRMKICSFALSPVSKGICGGLYGGSFACAAMVAMLGAVKGGSIAPDWSVSCSRISPAVRLGLPTVEGGIIELADRVRNLAGAVGMGHADSLARRRRVGILRFKGVEILRTHRERHRFRALGQVDPTAAAVLLGQGAFAGQIGWHVASCHMLTRSDHGKAPSCTKNVPLGSSARRDERNGVQAKTASRANA